MAGVIDEGSLPLDGRLEAVSIPLSVSPSLRISSSASGNGNLTSGSDAEIAAACRRIVSTGSNARPDTAYPAAEASSSATGIPMKSSVLRLASDSLRSSSEAAVTTTRVSPRGPIAGRARSLASPVMLRT